MNSNLSERIKQARKHAGLTQKELADKVGLSQTAIHKIECGRSRLSRKTVSIALTCGVDPIWLDTGLGEMALAGGAHYASVPGGTLKEGESYRPFPLIARIPLVSWDDMAKFCGESKDNFNPSITAWVPVSPRASERCFALKVPDDSMEPEFYEGEIIVVDPTMPGSHNQFLVAREGSNRPTFKQMIHHGDQQYLKPLNPRYPLIEVRGSLQVCGVAICKYKEYDQH
ncbi:MAG: helix-turn-helix domain-containing protein [Magnetococcales bacterium]|nr:helix-turn-helix domain-containing protein [Magnetococcales bacterium]